MDSLRTFKINFTFSANTGDGCEFTVDYCSVEGLCKNGGTCKHVFNGYKCHCAEGNCASKFMQEVCAMLF